MHASTVWCSHRCTVKCLYRFGCLEEGGKPAWKPLFATLDVHLKDLHPLFDLSLFPRNSPESFTPEFHQFRSLLSPSPHLPSTLNRSILTPIFDWGINSWFHASRVPIILNFIDPIYLFYITFFTYTLLASIKQAYSATNWYSVIDVSRYIV